MKKQIFVIDDSLPICRLLRSALQSDTVDVHYFTRVADALDSFMKHRYCLVIMDISVEGADGMELLQTIFQAKHVPILVITEDLNPDKGMKLLDAGATVCIRKPFALSVCSSQVNALIRLYTETEPSENGYYTLAFGTELIINPLHRQVKMNGSFLNLTRKEFDLLYYMASHPGQVFSRTQLYNRIWQDNSEFNIDEVVRFHVQALRRKLSPSGKDFIQTVWGIGYRFIDND